MEGTSKNKGAVAAGGLLSRKRLGTGDVLPYVGLAIVVAASVLPFVLRSVTDWAWESPEIHTDIELTCCMSGLAIIITLVGRSRGQLDGRTVLASAALVATAVLDGIHAFTPVGQAFVFLRGLAVMTAGALFLACWIPRVRAMAKGRRSLVIGMAFLTLLLGAITLAAPQGSPGPAPVPQAALGASLPSAIGGM